MRFSDSILNDKLSIYLEKYQANEYDCDFNHLKFKRNLDLLSVEIPIKCCKCGFNAILKIEKHKQPNGNNKIIRTCEDMFYITDSSVMAEQNDNVISNIQILSREVTSILTDEVKRFLVGKMYKKQYIFCKTCCNYIRDDAPQFIYRTLIDEHENKIRLENEDRERSRQEKESRYITFYFNDNKTLEVKGIEEITSFGEWINVFSTDGKQYSIKATSYQTNYPYHKWRKKKNYQQKIRVVSTADELRSLYEGDKSISKMQDIS